MDPQTPPSDQGHTATNTRSLARRLVRGVQLGFLIIASFQLGGPFLTAHNERQNQTYDAARHVFQDGWSAVLTPRASFSLPGYESRPYTVMRQEFPFHGLLGWPFVKWFGHERVVVRLVSIVFALFSIEFIYLILQSRLNPGSAAIGAALWGLSPLVLQFGQVPMPDILCTTGMLGAFWFALKPNLPASSAWFLFAILAKVSIIFFGLPILTALWLAKNCRTPGNFLRIALTWGIAPLIGLLAWTTLEILDPNTPWTVVKMISKHGGTWNLLTVRFYVFLLASLLPYGLGMLGILGVFRAVVRNAVKISPAILVTVLIAMLLYLVTVVAKIPEPQYILPLLAWLVMAAAFGLNAFAGGFPSPGRRAVLAAVVTAHVLVAIIFVCDLKSPHVPAIGDIETAAKLIPAHSHVIAAYPFYGASPAIWLGQNTYAVHSPEELEGVLPELRKDNFDYIIILDVKSHSMNSHKGPAALGAPATANLIDYTETNSPFRQFCDRRFTQIYATRYVVLYALKPGNHE